MRQIRNYIVHNNVIPSTDGVHHFRGRKFEMKKGKMMMGELDSFFFLVDVALDLYRNWLTAFL